MSCVLRLRIKLPKDVADLLDAECARREVTREDLTSEAITAMLSRIKPSSSTRMTPEQSLAWDRETASADPVYHRGLVGVRPLGGCTDTSCPVCDAA